MTTNVITEIHYLLDSKIDSVAGDRFLFHVGELLGTIPGLERRYGEDNLLRWATSYWMQQLLYVPDEVGRQQVARLMACTSSNGLLDRLGTIALPFIAQYDLPNVTIPIVPMADFTSTRYGGSSVAAH